MAGMDTHQTFQQKGDEDEITVVYCGSKSRRWVFRDMTTIAQGKETESNVEENPVSYQHAKEIC